MNVRDTLSDGDTSMCQNGKSMSIQKKVMGRTRKHVKNPKNLTLRSKFKVVSGSWMYATHRLMVTHACAKYGKPMTNHKKVMGRTRICTDRRTDRQTDRQSDSYIPPWTSFAGGIKIWWQFYVTYFGFKKWTFSLHTFHDDCYTSWITSFSVIKKKENFFTIFVLILRSS